MKRILILLLLCCTLPLSAGQFAKTELERTFLEAIAEDHPGALKDCLEKGVNPNVQDKETGNSALHYLLDRRNYHHEAIIQLLNHPLIDVNIQNTEDGDTPLHRATRRPHAIANKSIVLKVLQELSVQPAEEFYEKPAGIISHNVGDVSVDLPAISAQLLLKKQANPRIPNKKNKLPVHSACSIAALKLLMNSGSPIDANLLADPFILRDYHAFKMVLLSPSFNYNMAKDAIALMKNAKQDDCFKKPLCRNARILIYYCTMFDLLKSPKPCDTKKTRLPILPLEIVHHYFAVPATQAYIEKIQEIEKA